MKKRVVITDWNFPNLDPEIRTLSSAGCDVVPYQCRTEADVVEAVRQADLVITQFAPVKAQAIAAMRGCRGIIRYGIGLDNVDVTAATSRDIPVRNIPDYCLDEVADHTMALLLALQRQVGLLWDRVRAGEWKITPPYAFPPLRESTLGLIGIGRIGALVVRRARAFNMSIIACDPFVPAHQLERDGVESVSQEELLHRADIVSLHCPLTPATKHTLDENTFRTMKPTSLVINTSRGGLVNTSDLQTALTSGWISGAAVDVVEEEPLSKGHPLLQLPNAIVTSHTAWYSNRSISILQQRAADEALNLLQL